MSQNWTATNRPVATNKGTVGFRGLWSNVCRIPTEKFKQSFQSECTRFDSYFLMLCMVPDVKSNMHVLKGIILYAVLVLFK